MASRKTKKVDVNSEEHKQQQHKFNLQRLEERLKFISEPTYSFELGEEVRVGNLQDVVVNNILYNGKIIELDYTSVDNNYGNPIRNEHQKGYYAWMDVHKLNNNKTSIIQNDDIRINYYQSHLRGLLSKVYHFGVNFDPEYQREHVWNLDDKVRLIDSIYNNIDIGKFAFIRISDKDWIENGFAYEILDGKQRLRAILDYYEGRIAYKGFYYNDLSRRDQWHFIDYSVNVGEVSEISREQIIRYFLMLNTGGRIMSEEHLNKVRNMLINEQMK